MDLPPVFFCLLSAFRFSVLLSLSFPVLFILTGFQHCCPFLLTGFQPRCSFFLNSFQPYCPFFLTGFQRCCAFFPGRFRLLCFPFSYPALMVPSSAPLCAPHFLSAALPPYRSPGTHPAVPHSKDRNPHPPGRFFPYAAAHPPPPADRH